MIKVYYSLTEADIKKAFLKWEIDARVNTCLYMLHREEIVALSAHEVADSSTRQFIHFLNEDNPL
jgi:hypothetical protein